MSAWWPGSLGAAAVCSYVVGLPWAFEPDVPLIVLALLATVVANRRRCPTENLLTALGAAVVAFVVVTLASSAVSHDACRSIRLSVPLLPSVLMFVLMAGYFDRDDDLTMVYFACSLVALWLASVLFVAAWLHEPADPTALIAAAATPLLVVPNDAVFFAVVAPLSAGVLQADPSGVRRALATASLIGGAGAIVLLESRIATLSLVSALVLWVWLQTNGRVRFRGALTIVAAVLLTTDWIRGFPLYAKFANSLGWNPRLALWWSAIAMAADAPLLGHGPHSFGVLYRSYLATLEIPPWLPVDARVAPWPHNLFLEALAEQGVAGLGALLAVIGSGLWIAARTAQSGDQQRLPLVASPLAALTAFTIAATCEISFIRHWVVVMLLTLLGAVAFLSGRTGHPSPDRHRTGHTDPHESTADVRTIQAREIDPLGGG